MKNITRKRNRTDYQQSNFQYINAFIMATQAREMIHVFSRFIIYFKSISNYRYIYLNKGSL